MEPDIASRNFVVCVDRRWKSREAEKVKLCAPEHNTHPKVIELEIYPSNVEATLPQRIWSVKWLLEVGCSSSEVCSGVELSLVMPIVSGGYIAQLT